MRQLAIALACGTMLTGCTASLSDSQEPVFSASSTAIPADTGEAQIADLLSRMSVERKVAQLIMPDISTITPDDVETYRFGTVLNGGNSGPNGNDFAPAPEWLELADAYWDASVKPLENGEPAIPVLWGTDAVHGHSNIIGATVFPHNIGLGATRDPDLIRMIGAATATEIEVTGIDWTFAPTVAVARDDRWGRTYESYSEDPDLVSQMGVAMVEGLQGIPGADDFLGQGRVASTAKHFFGDGGTEQGVDQGDVNGDLQDLMAVHARPYPPVIEAGVASIMASFNSINGRKMHGNGPLLTGELRDRLGFDGLVIGDWNGHGQVAGCTNSNCPQALLAGLDVYMVPEEWKALYENTLAQVRDGTVPMARLDEAVTRVLRMKQQLGMFDSPKRPSERVNAGRWDKLGFAPHRAVAREAVAKSLVLLKNEGVLPLREGANILVAGSAANNIPQQAGGWSVTWQGGGDLTAEHFPGATSIFAGIAAQAEAAGGRATLSAEGAMPEGSIDVAIVVFGEQPYAEFVGDRKDTVFRDEEGLELLKKFKAEGVPTVAVFLSGRPLWMNRELNAANAFVAAWLPGSEGAGVADVLFGQRQATGRLSFSWPATCEGNPLNSSDGALYPLGFGLSFESAEQFAALSEECGALDAGNGSAWFTAGRLGAFIQAVADNAVLGDLRGTGNGITATGLDRNAQEDARKIRFQPGATLTLSGPDSTAGWRIAYKVDTRPDGAVTVTAGGETFDLSQSMLVAEGKGWREMVLTEQCLGKTGSKLSFTSTGEFTLDISQITREQREGETQCSF
ncbi:MAG: glycoside hydrolase family 3 N-terminal domain-containing protein [Erythrobacter sp.]|uniref:glycoside hydrolase family 3 protein n=1 Tax=Erythrobacter sp. TaxID=1042 RepID=UPI0032631A49